MRLILINPDNNKYVDKDDGFTESRSNARIFASILEADTYAAYLSHTYGVHVETRRA